jgi:hypothetical protein
MCDSGKGQSAYAYPHTTPMKQMLVQLHVGIRHLPKYGVSFVK